MMPKRHDAPRAPSRTPRDPGGSGPDPGLARFVLSRPGALPAPAKPLPSVLLLARPGADGEEIFAELSQREDLCLIRVANAAAADRTIEEMPVALVIACPEVPVSAIDSVLARLRRSRPGTPVLAVRARRAQEPPAWGRAGVAVLRMPLSSGVLSRSIDVVLGMRLKR